MATLEGEITKLSHELVEVKKELNITRDRLSAAQEASSKSTTETSSRIQVNDVIDMSHNKI